MKRFVFSILIVALIIPFSAINAQTSLASDKDINVEISPSNPAPNSNVGIYITSYIIDLNSSTITWILNGVNKKSGRGATNFSFITGGYGQNNNLTIAIRTTKGEYIEKVVRIKPSDIDIIWESEGYTPPFYRGKSPFSYQNNITFIAIPHITGSNGVEISPSNLIYKWKNNGFVIENASGYGKNTYSIKGSIISRPIEITVEAVSVDGTLIAGGNTVVTPKNPEVLLYKKSPIYGIEFQKTLTGELNLAEKEIAVIGIPYFFGTLDSNSVELNYKWLINGVDTNTNETTQIFRQKEGSVGVSNISISIENMEEILQSAKNSFKISFGGSNTNQTGL